MSREAASAIGAAKMADASCVHDPVLSQNGRRIVQALRNATFGFNNPYMEGTMGVQAGRCRGVAGLDKRLLHLPFSGT
jgi:hypothetical protein